MSDLSKTAKSIVKNIAVLGIIEAIFGSILVVAVFGGSFVLGHVLGIVLGTAASLGRIIHMESSINATMKLEDQAAAAKYFRLQYFLRMFVTAGLIGISIWLHPIVNIASVAVGLSNTAIGTYMYKISNKEK